MSQLTRQDIAEVVEEVVDRKLNKRFTDFEKKIDSELNRKLDRRFADFENKLNRKLGVLIEHTDNNFDCLAEALQVMSGTMSTLARDSDLQEVKQGTRTIGQAVRVTNDDLRRLENRFDGLEQRFSRWEQAAI